MFASVPRSLTGSWTTTDLTRNSPYRHECRGQSEPVIRIAESADGLLLAVKARPGSRRNAVVGEQDGALKVAVQAPPEKGKANKAVGELLAKVLGLKKNQVEIARGETCTDKVFRIGGLTADELEHRVRTILDELVSDN